MVSKRNTMCALGLLLALGASEALAADLPTQKASPTPVYTRPSAYDWTGFYFGGNVGGNVTSNYNADTMPGTTFPFNSENEGVVPITHDVGTGGVIGGLQTGYNYQFGWFVGGVEADISAVQAGGRTSWTSYATLDGSTFTTSPGQWLDYIGTVRLRAGYALDRWLMYVTGGFAYGGIRNTDTVVMDSDPQYVWHGSSNQFRTGYTLGGGVEYAWTNNILLRLEGLYYNLGSTINGASGNAAVSAVPALNALYYQNKTTAGGGIFRVGMDYKF